VLPAFNTNKPECYTKEEPPLNFATDIQISTLEDLQTLEKVPLEERNLPSSTYALLCESAERYSDKTALRFLPQSSAEEPSVTYTYRELLEKITRTANALSDLGVEAGDTVSMLLPNLPQTHFAIWGAEAVGIFNPINPLLEVEHIAAILNEVKARVLVTLAGTDLWDKAQAVIEQVPSLTAVLVVDLAGFLSEGLRASIVGEGPKYLQGCPVKVLDFDDFISAYPGDALQSSREIQSEDIASYFHTGGTTGTPKLAPHTHANEVALAWQMATCTGMDEDYVGLCGLPLFHVNAVFITGLAPWSVGAEVLLASPQGYRNPATLQNFWSLVERYRVSYFSAVPTILGTLLEQPSEGRDLSSLQYCLCGAAPLATELMRNFEARTGLVVIEGYGQTEGTCASSCNPLYGERRVGSVGLRLPYTQMRTVIVDESGHAVRDCETNEVGVIAISGPTVFSGYKQPEQNRGQWVDDGWFNTGDLGRLDEDGYLWLTGRSKDLIIRGGHNIDPQMIEEALYKHPAVAEAAAVGKPDARVGELPVVYVQLKEGAEVAEAELLAFAAERINERAAVPKEVHLIEQMPMTAVGKIFKPDLRNDITRRVVERELQRVLENSAFEVCVEVSKKHGQIATVKTAAAKATEEKIKAALGVFAFRYEVEAWS